MREGQTWQEVLVEKRGLCCSALRAWFWAKVGGLVELGWQNMIQVELGQVDLKTMDFSCWAYGDQWINCEVGLKEVWAQRNWVMG